MKRVIALFATVAAMMSACSKSDMVGSFAAEGLVFTGVSENPVSKVVVDRGDDGYFLKWETGDEVVISDGTNSAVYNVKEGGSDKAVFIQTKVTSELDADAASYTAVYPSSIVKEGGLVFPKSYIYQSERSANYPMIAKSATTDFRFRNPCGILKLMLYSDRKNMDITSIVVTADKAICGNATIDFDNSTISIAEDGDKVFTLYCPDPLRVAKGAEAVPVMLTLPTGGYELTITVYTADGSSETIVRNVEIEPSTITKHGVNTSDVVFQYGYGDTNCIIASPGVKSLLDITPFAITGNSLRDEAASLSAAPLADGCRIVWSEFSGQVSAGIEDGRLAVTTPSGEYGNALVAITSGDDVIWSYHIWVPEGDPTELVTYSSGARFMSMALGAIDKVVLNDEYYVSDTDIAKGYGTYYQYGRKDPFSRADKIMYDKVAKTVATVSASSICKGNNYNSSDAVKYVTANPGTFISFNSGYEGDWASSRKATVNTSLWGERKTVYDPCPKGYRVPSSDVFASMIMDNPSIEFEDHGAYIHATPSVLDFWPANGERGDGTGAGNGGINSDLLGVNGYYWACDCGNGGAWYFRYRSDGLSNYCSKRGYCYGVRCIAE